MLSFYEIEFYNGKNHINNIKKFKTLSNNLRKNVFQVRITAHLHNHEENNTPVPKKFSISNTSKPIDGFDSK